MSLAQVLGNVKPKAKAYGCLNSLRFCGTFEVVGTSLPLDLACFRTVLRNRFLGGVRRHLSAFSARDRSTRLGLHELSQPNDDLSTGSCEANIENYPRNGSVRGAAGNSAISKTRRGNAPLVNQRSSSDCCARHNRAGLINSHRIRHVGRERVQLERLGAHSLHATSERSRVGVCTTIGHHYEGSARMVRQGRWTNGKKL